MVTTVAPATLSVQRDASRKRFWMDKAREGDERARQRCIRKGWIVEEAEVDESFAERRMEAFCGARMAGASMEAAWQEVDAIRGRWD
jgi:hypothetical protein